MSAAGTQRTPATSRRSHEPAPPRDGCEGHKDRRGRGDRRGRARPAPAVPYLLVTPAVAVISLVLGYPLYRLIVLSFQHYSLAEIISHKTNWLGLRNYQDIFSDQQFWAILNAGREVEARPAAAPTVQAAWSA